MTDKKAYPVTPHAPTGFVPAPAQPAAYSGTLAGAAPYGVFPNQPQLYAAQGPPPPAYDQTLPMLYHPYGQGYAGYLPTSCYSPYGPIQYYPPLPAAATYYPAAAMQPPVRPPTLVMPNGFDAANRFDNISQPVLPPPPTVPNAAQLAAMASHSVAISHKKNFLGGGTEGGYTFW